jgi:D-alanyl-D-alanine carboxypeptidase
MKRLAVIVLAGLLTAAQAGARQAPAGQSAHRPAPTGTAAAIDRLAAEEFGTGGPGGALIVVRDGKTLVRKGYGYADVELKVPVRPEMIFRLGSVTKQFTAALVMMLVDERKIGLGDDITKYLPDYPTRGKPITIEHLLTHTSGVKDYTRLPRVMGDANTDRSVAEVIDAFKSEPLDFDPGRDMAYSNSGYFLLGAVLEKVTGRPYAELVSERIFKPLGMTHSSYIDRTRILPDRARGYQEVKGTLVNARYYSDTLPYAAGGLMSSVDDLALWDAALSGGRLLAAPSRERMLSSGKLSNGRETGYGYGWYTYEYDGLRMQEHGGVIFGYIAYVLRVPDRGLYVALLTNRQVANAEPFLLARKAALAALGRPFANPAKAVVAPSDIDACVGSYGADGKTVVDFGRRGDRLVMTRPRSEPIELLPASATEYFQERTFLRVTFEKDASGRVQNATVSDWGSSTAVARAAKPSAGR